MLENDNQNDNQNELLKPIFLDREHKSLLDIVENEDKQKLDLNAIIIYLPIVFNYLQNEKDDEACLRIYALKNILQIISSREDYFSLFTEFVLNPDFLTFVFQNLSNDCIHPFFLKNLLKIICMIIENVPQEVNQLLENDLNNILLSLLPNKYASKCIIALINCNENYRNELFESQFHKQILQMISNLEQMNTDLRYYYEKTYIDILIALHSYFHFDELSYNAFLSFFVRNFSPRKEIHTQSQKSYINFLLKSTDPKLMQMFVYYPKNIIVYLLDVFNKPAYSKVRSDVLAYFELIAQSSVEYATLFTGPQIGELIERMFVVESKILSITRLIFTICLSSYDNCQNLISYSVFQCLNFHFQQCTIEIKNSIYKIFDLLLRYPPNSPFFSFFSDLNLFDSKPFFEFIDINLQNESELKNDILILFNTLFDYVAAGGNQVFLNDAVDHMISDDFYEIIQTCSESKDLEFADHSKLLLKKIESIE